MDVGLHRAGGNQASRRSRCAGGDLEPLHAEGLDGLDGVVRRCLVQPVIERIQKRTLEREGAAQRRLAVSEDIVGKPNSRFGQELSPVLEQRGIADERIGRDHAVGKGVVGRSPLGLIPAIGRFEADAGADFEPRRHLDCVLHKAGAFERPPAQFRGIGHHGEGRALPRKKGLKRVE